MGRRGGRVTPVRFMKPLSLDEQEDLDEDDFEDEEWGDEETED
jgi:hypothetical protein